MVRIYLPYVARVIESLGSLTAVSESDVINEKRWIFYSARQSVNEFLFGSIWSGALRVSKDPGSELIKILADLIDVEDEAETVGFFRSITLSAGVNSFRTVLESEFQTSGVYLVTPRRGYDIPTLLDNAEVIFPKELVEKVPEVLFDLRQAGKCIAFDLGTSAGFHLLRALESVICKYWDKVMDGKPLPDNRNIGRYINEMEKAQKGDGKVLTALRQIKDFHRNSLMHPEETLNLDEAIALLGIVQSAVVAMLPTIEAPKQNEGVQGLLE